MDEENLLVGAAKERVWRARKPPGWTTRESRGRPRKRGPGRPEVFHWRAAAVVLLLQQYLGLDYRGMAAHLAAIFTPDGKLPSTVDNGNAGAP